jgi:hypothetical protein
MQRLRISYLVGGWFVIVAIAIGVLLSSADRIDAQPRFRDFDPPRNPVANSVNHRFDFPGNVRAEVRRGQRGPGKAYSAYVKVYDEHETVSLMIPADWNDVELDHAVNGEHSSGVKIEASSDLLAYREGRAAGITLTAVPSSNESNADISILEKHSEQTSRSCGKGRFDRHAYEDPFFSGHYDFYSACGHGGNQIVLAAFPGHRDVSVVVEADLAAVTKVFDSFQVIGIPGHDDHHDYDDDEGHDHVH